MIFQLKIYFAVLIKLWRLNYHISDWYETTLSYSILLISSTDDDKYGNL